MGVRHLGGDKARPAAETRGGAGRRQGRGGAEPNSPRGKALGGRGQAGETDNGPAHVSVDNQPKWWPRYISSRAAMT